MSKLIVEMEMKNRCIKCQVRLACKRYIEALQTMDGIEKMRAKIGSYDCLIKGVLPEQHGDLVDRDELKEKFIAGDFIGDYARKKIDAAPTVIAAERKDDEQQ